MLKKTLQATNTIHVKKFISKLASALTVIAINDDACSFNARQQLSPRVYVNNIQGLLLPHHFSQLQIFVFVPNYIFF